MSLGVFPVRGASLVGGVEADNGSSRYASPATSSGHGLDVEFVDATADEVGRAVGLARDAIEEVAGCPPRWWSQLLRTIQTELNATGDQIIEIADRETALGVDRLRSELVRTCDQLGLFARLVERGEHLEATIDQPDADPSSPSRDLRRVNVPVGPVAVFGASNFPLAFGVPGTDTVSAIAAGCGVVTKAHPSHPATSEVTARAILAGLRRHGAPEGLFSLIHGSDPEVSVSLVEHPGLRAVGFTGSQPVGRRLFDLASRRPDPIPVYAEMGSLNPVFVTESALTRRGGSIAAGLVDSATLSGGQFCTKPGLIVIPPGEAGDDFVARVVSGLASVEPVRLLNPGIDAAFGEWRSQVEQLEGVRVEYAGDPGADGFGAPVLAVTDFAGLCEHDSLLREHFGPFLLVVLHHDPIDIAGRIHGALAATMHAEQEDDVDRLLGVLKQRVGRVVWNDFPTGVAVTRAMHHGGPYPATTFPAHTSVGTAAVNRFQRPVCFQDLPDDRLPKALRSDNPWRILRWVDGELSKDDI